MNSKEESDEEDIPLVDDFIKYYPWAVGQFPTGVNVLVRKVIHSQLVSSSYHSVNAKKKRKIVSEVTKSQRQIVSEESINLQQESSTIIVTADYNKSGSNLVALKFEKGMTIPRAMLNVLGLIIQFHLKLESISFAANADQYVIYELSKILPVSNITDICLDGSNVKEGNFHILLDENCNLKVFSLARCSITDDVLKLLMDKLVFPMAAGFTLKILNFSSNLITDVGAKYIADALRLNKQLYHLNLADNSITEDGADEILNIFLDFPITDEEVIYARQLRYTYLKEKQKLMNELVATSENLPSNVNGKDDLSKVNISTSSLLTGTRKKKVKLNIGKSKILYDNLIENITKAHNKAQLALGLFQDPLSGQVTKDGIIFSTGNNTLCSLNLAYNNLSFNNVKKLLQVLKYQRELNRKPVGLINVNIEGNPLPVTCNELRQINTLLELGTTSTTQNPAHLLKGKLVKTPSKSSRLNAPGRLSSDRRLKKPQ